MNEPEDSSDSWPEANRTLDTTGLRCPIPIVKTAREIESMNSRQVLEVLSDDRGITEDLPAWCQANSHSLLLLDRGEQSDVYHGFIEKVASSI